MSVTHPWGTQYITSQTNLLQKPPPPYNRGSMEDSRRNKALHYKNLTCSRILINSPSSLFPPWSNYTALLDFASEMYFLPLESLLTSLPCLPSFHVLFELWGATPELQQGAHSLSTGRDGSAHRIPLDVCLDCAGIFPSHPTLPASVTYSPSPGNSQLGFFFFSPS